jgi:formate dehydrogenase iron-sulfur subunit
MSYLDALEVRQSSASVWGAKTELRNLKVVSKLIDTSTCIGCKACEVACQEWNDLHIVPTTQRGTYQTMPSLDANYWNLIQFREREVGPDFAWLLRKDGCMHCGDPGCLKACPAPGAIVQYQNGIVDVNPDNCIGCKMCETGCPFDIPRYSEQTGKMSKCTLCVDRGQVGLEPACVKSCPTGCLEFGDKTDLVARANVRVEQLKQNGFPQAALYDPPGVGGTTVITVLAHGDHPEWYGLPKDPHVPDGVRFWKNIARPLGALAIAGAFFSMVGHYLAFGPKKPKEGAETLKGEGPG